VEYFILGGSALLPLINPPGSALELLSVVGIQSEPVNKSLARKIAVKAVIFLAAFGVGGSHILRFFGISLRILWRVSPGGDVTARRGSEHAGVFTAELGDTCIAHVERSRLDSGIAEDH